MTLYLSYDLWRFEGRIDQLNRVLGQRNVKEVPRSAMKTLGKGCVSFALRVLDFQTVRKLCIEVGGYRMVARVRVYILANLASVKLGSLDELRARSGLAQSLLQNSSWEVTSNGHARPMWEPSQLGTPRCFGGRGSRKHHLFQHELVLLCSSLLM